MSTFKDSYVCRLLFSFVMKLDLRLEVKLVLCIYSGISSLCLNLFLFTLNRTDCPQDFFFLIENMFEI